MCVGIERKTPRADEFCAGSGKEESFLWIVKYAVDLSLQSTQGITFLSVVAVCIPDKDDAVAATAGEFFSIKGEGQCEDSATVGFPLFDDLVLGSIKKREISEGTADGDQISLWMKRETAGIKADLEALLKCAVVCVVAMEITVVGGGEYGLIIVCKTDSDDFACVTEECAQALCRRKRPQSRRFVAACRSEDFVVAADRKIVDRVGVCAQRMEQLAVVARPDADLSIFGSGDQGGVVGTEGGGADRFAVFAVGDKRKADAAWVASVATVGGCVVAGLIETIVTKLVGAGGLCIVASGP